MSMRSFQFFMVLFLLLQLSAVGSQPSAADLKSDHILIKFEDANPDTLGLSLLGDMANDSWIIPVKEEIKKYPENYETINTFYLPVQFGQYAINLASKNKEVHELILEDDSEFYNTGMKYSQYLHSRYTTEPVDCIISVCVVKKGENEFVIIDVNNDEDFTNDPVLPYSTIPANTTPDMATIQKQEYVDSNAYVEYCDRNKKVISKEIPIRFSKISTDSRQNYLYSIRNIKCGTLSIDNEEYLVTLSDGQNLDYSVESTISIDSNKNSKFDDKDCSARLFQPFSFNGNSYNLYEMDPMGDYIILEKSDVPVVQVGFQSPDFDSITIDSKRFKLSEYRGKFVLIEFWGTWCGPCIGETPFLKEAYAQFNKKGFEIVGIGVHDDLDRIKTYIQENKIGWTQIYQKSNEIVKLYQVDGFPSAFLVNTEGVLVNKGSELRGENLKSTLEQYFKND